MFICLLLAYAVSADTDGPWALLGSNGYAGEVVINNATGSSLFYWQFNALNGNISTDTRPLIMWLQGGPGCSGLNGMFGERISPIYVDDSSVPHFNNKTWALHFHLLEVDFPLTAGYSYAMTSSDIVNNTIGAVAYLYTFLQRLTVKYPSWFARDLYILGESYGGHWVPALAYKIYMENQSLNVTNNNFIRLKGIGLGDPLGDALYQTQNFDTFTYNLGLSNAYQANQISQTESLIYSNIMQENYTNANNYLNQVHAQIESYTNNVSLYNIRYYTVEDTGGYQAWLNQTSVKGMVHVPANVTWIHCNGGVNQAFSEDKMQGFITPMMPVLLSNMKVLIYSGQDDLLINMNGIENWISNLQWPAMRYFLQTRRGPWYVEGNVAGYAQTYSNFTFVQVLKAGHYAPFDQPDAVKDMVFRFIMNMGWN